MADKKCTKHMGQVFAPLHFSKICETTNFGILRCWMLKSRLWRNMTVIGMFCYPIVQRFIEL